MTYIVMQTGPTAITLWDGNTTDPKSHKPAGLTTVTVGADHNFRSGNVVHLIVRLVGEVQQDSS